jgi:hypothetical protein
MNADILRKFLSFGNHPVNLLLAETTFLVGDGNALRFATAKRKR